MDQWAKPALEELSFFKPTATDSPLKPGRDDRARGEEIDDDDSNRIITEKKKRGGAHIFRLPFTAAFLVLRFLDIKTVTCRINAVSRGFAELLQSVPVSAWIDRLLEALYPRSLFAQLQMPEMQDLRQNALRAMHQLLDRDMQQQQQPQQATSAAQHAVIHNDKGNDDDEENVVMRAMQHEYLSNKSRKEMVRIWRALRYFEPADKVAGAEETIKNSSCRVCHLPPDRCFLVRRQNSQVQSSDNVLADLYEWSRCWHEVRAFLLRGDSDSASAAVAATKDGDSSAAGAATETVTAAAVRGAVGGLFTPFSYKFLLKRDPKRHFERLGAEMERVRLQAAERAAFHQEVIASGRQKSLDVLVHSKPAQAGDESSTASSSSSSSSHEQFPSCPQCGGRGSVSAVSAEPLSAIIGLKGAEDVENYDSSILLKRGVTVGCDRSPPPPGPELQKILQMRTVLERHEIEYFALVASAVVTSVRTYHFPNELKRQVISRVTNPLVSRSVEMRFFQTFRNDGRFLANLLIMDGSGGPDANSTAFSDRIADYSENNGSSPELLQLFITGYGRVEVDKAPKISVEVCKKVSEILGLSPGFPLALLWNVLLAASGAVIDLLPRINSLRVHHRIELRNWFEEMLVSEK